MAAEPIELAGILRRCAGLRRENLPAAFARSGELAGNKSLLIANGAGPRLAREAVEAGSCWNPEVVVSTGLCGALDPALRLYDLFVADRVNQHPAARPSSGRTFESGTLVSLDRFIGSPEEKRTLFRGGARAVEMEAGAVAEFAVANGLPFYCLRIVSDTAREGSLIDLNAMRRPDGGFHRGRVALAGLKKPFTAGKELAQWFRRARFASGLLGEFIADCRF